MLNTINIRINIYSLLHVKAVFGEMRHERHVDFQ